MKTFKLILLTLALIIPSLAKADTVDLTDGFSDEFSQYLRKQYSSYVNGDQLTIDRITSLNFSSAVNNAMYLTDVTGINKLKYVTSITLPKKPKFTTLDVSGMVNLTSIDNNGGAVTTTTNQTPTAAKLSEFDGVLQTINASGCVNLQKLYLNFYRSLENLDFTGATKITQFQAHYTNLKSIDLSHNTLIQSQLLLHQMNKLTSIKLGNQPNITILHIKDAPIRHIDLSGMTNATNITLMDDKLKDIVMPPAKSPLNAFYFYNLQLTHVYLLDHSINQTQFTQTSPQKRYVGTETTLVKLFHKSIVSDYYYNTSNVASGHQIVLGDDDYYYYDFKSTKTNGSYRFNFRTTAGKTGYMTVSLLREDDPDPDPEERTVEDFYLVRVADSPLYLADNEDYNTAFNKSTDVKQFAFDKTTADGDEYSISNLLLNGYYRIANNSNLDEATINFGGTEVEDYKHPLLLVGKTYNLTLGSENNLSTHHDANNDKKADLNITGAKFVYRGEGATDAAAIAEEVTPSTFTITEGKATGLENVVAEEAAGVAEYYTIQGVKADAANLAPGIYIVRQGSKTSKVIIR